MEGFVGFVVGIWCIAMSAVFFALPFVALYAI